ncbi:DUF2938 family protein [Tropicibacter sp. R16_0]|uniref:DUF2938 family protein n=1 Tax=Tropicibacter sp. R16_0 TaxID=2821102 RepID=UPI001ADB64D4|nr:DUF2938 family protein [Tropicibacter sp. R16_0]MBO9452117.1 DUF2938 family protein [Tropicibacter sp. R16_0]
MDFWELMTWGGALGLGATLITDCVGVLRQGFAATHGFYCLVGRWLGSVHRQGLFRGDIRAAQPIQAEAALGWAAHIGLGVGFGMAFAALFGPAALRMPQVWQGLSFGVLTVLVPWLVFQPFFGWGIAVSKTPEPWRMRLRGLITHAVFGLGLWLSALLLSGLID